MTSDKNPADVIKQSAEVIARASWEAVDGPDVPWGDVDRDDRDKCRALSAEVARALADAGLLADPADRDEHFMDAVARVTPCTCSAQRHRADRAEVELAVLRSDFAKLRQAHTWRCAELDRAYEQRDELIEVVERVAKLADQWRPWPQSSVYGLLLDDALDGAGDAPNQQIEGGQS